jgi:hypothetical protein
MSKQTEKDAKRIEELNALLVEKGFPGTWTVYPGSGRRSKLWRWTAEDKSYWSSFADSDGDYILMRLRRGNLTYDEREFYHFGDRWSSTGSLAQHKEEVAEQEAEEQEQAAKDARLAELEAWYAEYQTKTNVSTQQEVEMAFPKLIDFTRDQIETAVEQNDFERILLSGTVESRRILNEVLRAKLEEQPVQQDRPAQVEVEDETPEEDHLQALLDSTASTDPNVLRLLAKVVSHKLTKAADKLEMYAQAHETYCRVREEQEARIKELEAQLAAHRTAHPCLSLPDEACTCDYIGRIDQSGKTVFEVAQQPETLTAAECYAIVQAELAQQEAAKGVTESAEEVDLDPAAPYRGSDDRPVVVAKPVEPETPRSKLRSDEYLTRVLEDLGLPGQFKLRQDGGYFWSLPDDGAHFFRVRCLMDYKDKIEQQLRDGSLNPSIFDTCQECGTHMPPEETLSEIVQDGSVNKTEREKYVGIITNLEHKLRESSADLKDMCDMNTQLTTESMKLKKQLAERETPSEIVSDCARCAELEQELKDFKAETYKNGGKREGRIGELEGRVGNLKDEVAMYKRDNERLSEANGKLQEQLAQAEQDVDQLTDCDQVVKELAETKQMLKMITEAKDKGILRNRELESENQTLRSELEDRDKMIEDLRAELDKLNGMGA